MSYNMYSEISCNMILLCFYLSNSSLDKYEKWTITYFAYAKRRYVSPGGNFHYEIGRWLKLLVSSILPLYFKALKDLGIVATSNHHLSIRKILDLSPLWHQVFQVINQRCFDTKGKETAFLHALRFIVMHLTCY